MTIFKRYFSMLLLLFLPIAAAHALLSMELTQGVAGAIPIIVQPFAIEGGTPLENVASIVGQDLKNSGRFKIVADGAPGTEHKIIGKIKKTSANDFQIQFQLINLYGNKNAQQIVLSKQFTVPAIALRKAAHKISDLVFLKITGIRGVFSTKIAYVVTKRQAGRTQYTLEVADMDGYNPQTLLTSSEPIMSPTFSPSGKTLAYVSFEKRHAGIFVQTLANGQRTLLSDFPGINGAPGFSPDGKRVALVLSKNGTPNIYMMDIVSHHLSPLTHDFYINTEPAWSPNGQYIIFTSNRSGHPQIYQLNLKTHRVERLTFDGTYNARGTYSRDGKFISLIHRVDGVYQIALLDLDRGHLRELTHASADSTSPSMAPNGSMVLYDTSYGGREGLAMVSTDGNVQLHLPTRDGNAQDPAWSPYLD